LSSDETQTMNLQTLSTFALARLLNDAAEGSAFHRALKEEIRTRNEMLRHSDNKTPWLFNDQEWAAMIKKWRGVRK
jgi:hypothetical protein